MTSSAVIDLYAVSPAGQFPKQVVLRVLAYEPSRSVMALPGLRLRVQPCLDHGEPIPEDPILELEGVTQDEVHQFLSVSREQGWRMFPFVAPCRLRSRVSS